MIRFENLQKSFRKTHVLKGLDLDIARGDRIALVGSNGAGKTTMIRCLLGEYTHEGIVTVNGLDPRTHRTEVLGRIGFVPQLPPPLKLGVGPLIDFAAELCGSDPARMIAVASQLGLDIAEMKGRPFVKLSGGEKQKLLIGIALGRDSDLLVMDEPAANLDPVARQVFFGLLAERRDNVSMIISSHRLDEVASLVNRVVELDRGRIVLNDHVDDRLDMASVLDCIIDLAAANPAFANAIEAWDFAAENEGCRWRGTVAGPDRLRFLGMLSRYAAVLRGIEMKERESD
ncbi:MAG: ABC transporter ATP-binding protein [Candidatus Krumholzibacteria bacterium]|nr:ABC transporter ATP-binding protein [Candidatus Krumholzibacteria bacterium]